MLDKNNRYPLILLAIFSIVWLVLAISPNYRDVWVAENILSVALVIGLILTYKYFRFSNTSYTLLFFFLVFHTIGAHYTYAEMPLFTILQSSFGLARNHYDRVVHFLFGLIFYLPLYEFITLKIKLKGAWAHIMTFLTIFSLKGFYEILEWWYALIMESNVIDTFFLGAQGDAWDAQKDMVLGVAGALIAGVIISMKHKFTRN